MSHQATAWLLWFSESRLADRLVLNVIAYHVSNDSGDSWPSIATIVEESALSERQVYDSIKVLCASGELLVREEPSNRGTNCYHMPKFFEWLKQVHPAKSAPCKASKMQVQDVQNAGAKSADESSLEPLRESSNQEWDKFLTGKQNKKAKKKGTPYQRAIRPGSPSQPEPRRDYAAEREANRAAKIAREDAEILANLQASSRGRGH